MGAYSVDLRKKLMAALEPLGSHRLPVVRVGTRAISESGSE